MMISDEQVRRVTECLRSNPVPGIAPAAHQDFDSAFIAGIVDTLCSMPEIRLDRVEHARQMISGHMPDSEELASKLVGRLLSDSLR